MNVVVEVFADPGGQRPAARCPVLVQLRDTRLADAPAVVLAESAEAVADADEGPLARVALIIDSVPRGTTVWVHVDVDRSGSVSVGDYITKQSFPVPDTPSGPVRVTVSKV